jgi:hypothetical protein
MGQKRPNPHPQALGSLGGKARAKSLSSVEIAKIASRGGKARAEKLSAHELSRIGAEANLPPNTVPQKLRKTLPGQPQEHEPEKKSQEKRSDGVYHKESPFGLVFWSRALSAPVYIRIERQVIGNSGEYNGKAKNATRKMVSYKRHYKKNCPDCEDNTREEM